MNIEPPLECAHLYENMSTYTIFYIDQQIKFLKIKQQSAKKNLSLFQNSSELNSNNIYNMLGCFLFSKQYIISVIK